MCHTRSEGGMNWVDRAARACYIGRQFGRACNAYCNIVKALGVWVRKERIDYRNVFVLPCKKYDCNHEFQTLCIGYSKPTPFEHAMASIKLLKKIGNRYEHFIEMLHKSALRETERVMILRDMRKAAVRSYILHEDDERISRDIQISGKMSRSVMKMRIKKGTEFSSFILSERRKPYDAFQ